MKNKGDAPTDKQRNNSGRFTVGNRWRFKPGQSGNPKGRPKPILSKRERLELLSEMAKMNKHKANPVEAIREQNRMEGVYAEVQPAFQNNRQYNIYIAGGDEAKARLERLMAGERPQAITQDVVVEGEVEQARE